MVCYNIGLGWVLGSGLRSFGLVCMGFVDSWCFPGDWIVVAAGFWCFGAF